MRRKAIDFGQEHHLAHAKSKKAMRPTRAGGRGKTSEPVDFGPLQDWVGFRLRMAQDAAFQSFSRLSREIGVKPGRFATLTIIAHNPGISQTALSRANGRDKSTLTPLLADFVRRGIIRRIRTRKDRRIYRLTLTRAGVKLLAQLSQCAKVHEKNLDRVIGTRDRKNFVRILHKIANELGWHNKIK